ncbi:hypothetical protein DI005_33245 [Prauserella sp. PE36]|uniref:hypothetical protein n=1 Tax=Prauserella sp. PE36 TaxID=1504709 RepID=UPI000D91A8E6|nr:hypothetical protein [Prauserella sp. PE36]PXY17887.1 hypothetical protein BAY59_35460 [Prauserella coralliicola]RBM12127.1 hypothetical protein DI005_33245 [Prauserella sp. PE36]
MSTPELLTADEQTRAADERRLIVWESTHALVGAAAASGALWLVTEAVSGGWVVWSLLLLGAVAAEALYAVADLLGLLFSRLFAREEVKAGD